MFAPNLAPAVLMGSRTGSLPPYWHEAMTWLRTATPPPFVHAAGTGDEYYLARYAHDRVPRPDYTVMNWWDHGYWVIQIARRVPISNPTQERAPNAARFYAATNEADARALLDAEQVRYVLADWELPFRLTPQGTVMGRFQNVVDWAGAEHAKYYEVYYRRENDGLTPVWVFHEPYYRSMAYRLVVMGGAPAVPANATSVLVVADRTDQSGLRFREILSATTHPTIEAARAAERTLSVAGHTVIVGLDPWRPAFPVEGLIGLRQVHESRTADQKPGEAPWVRVFEVGLGAGAPR